jgi:hypothetical protein
MNQVSEANALSSLRRAVDKNLFKGGPPVYARELHKLKIFRVVGVKYSRSTLPPTVSGKDLATGKWVPIAEWEVRPNG